MKAARENWVDDQDDLDPEHLIFIDESGLSTKMARLRGWAPKGRALPRRHSARSLEDRHLCRRTHACGLRCTDAAGRADGRRMLPRLGRTDAGANLAPRRHRRHGQSGRPQGRGVRQAIEACGAELHYLPPYSPDLNPIENAFAKLKAHVRKSAARTLDALERAAANALPQFKPDQCANFFAHAGYRLD